MGSNTKGVHEVNELHEMLTFKNVCMTKSAVIAGVAQDPALQSLLQQDVNMSMKHCQDLKNLLS
ncbi:MULTISPECIES: spore coat protein [unclassified Bacillus (in: firmicutes)]|uniref:spore coat protein n=1 Tax=unclassified Bacillus (in: firmicutes) TaxID=185979 RepID=UPI0008EA476B|nr:MULTISPECIES: spore coat protein [unclassified Bacillus (in: firmicutes)]SFH95833.1 similar to spore coat protein [Bacillus sp. 71mf]SFS94921.1 similar to spore coat protein [Bacillus sp. 103mf]